MLKIALAQMTVVGANPEKNYQTLAAMVDEAVHTQHQLIVFPEMAIPGYLNGDLWNYAAFAKECEHYQQQVATLSHRIAIIFGGLGCRWDQHNEDGTVRKYNAAFCAQAGHFATNQKTGLGFWPKTLSPNYGKFDDSRYFYDLRKLAWELDKTIAELYEPFVLRIDSPSPTEFSVGISICEDAWSHTYAKAPLKEASTRHNHHFFVNLSASPFYAQKPLLRQQIFSDFAHNTNAPLVQVNAVGVQNQGKTISGFDGSSAAYAADGHTILKAPAWTSGLHSVIYQNTTLRPALAPQLAPYTSPTQHLHEALEYIVGRTCKEWNIQRVVIGVSGGIDSALGATLMTRILGPDNVFLVTMPSSFNASKTQEAARELALNLGCPFASVPIEASVQELKRQVEQVVFHSPTVQKTLTLSPSVFENVQARERGARFLGALAAALGGVFVCNVNKAEMTSGYGTFYGDLTGFLSPLGDLWKHQIYELAHFYNTQVFATPPIPADSLHMVPCAELGPQHDVLAGKGDPLHYPYHDFLFRSWVEAQPRTMPEDNLKAYLGNRLEEQIGCAPGLVARLFPTAAEFCKDLEYWWSLYQGLGAFKRVQAPPVVSLSARTFGADHREQLGSAILTANYQALKRQHRI